jgi:hypothetical protein
MMSISCGQTSLASAVPGCVYTCVAWQKAKSICWFSSCFSPPLLPLDLETTNFVCSFSTILAAS